MAAIAPIVEGDKPYIGNWFSSPAFSIRLMSILPNFLRSLALAILLSFAAPVAVVTVLLTPFLTISLVPGLEVIGQTGTAQMLQFLAVFGAGNPLEGIITIGLSCSFVGALFDAYTFYRYQTLNDLN